MNCWSCRSELAASTASSVSCMVNLAFVVWAAISNSVSALFSLRNLYGSTFGCAIPARSTHSVGKFLEPVKFPILERAHPPTEWLWV